MQQLLFAADILIVAGLLYAFISILRTFRMTPLLMGCVTLCVIYAITYFINLPLTRTLFQEFVSVLAIILVIIFQRELRQYLEVISFYRIGSFHSPIIPDNIRIIEETVKHLSAQKTGALIIIPGHDPLDRYILNRYTLNGKLSTPILQSIFDTSSPGHDGAVIVEGTTIVAYGVYLYLNRPYHTSKKYGTRHLAALGLAKTTDALIIVVSEERGTISVASTGEMKQVSVSELVKMLTERMEIQATAKTVLVRYVKNEAVYILTSIILALLLWSRMVAHQFPSINIK